MALTDPKDFGLSDDERVEKDRGYLGLSMRDRKIMLQMIDNVPIDEILDYHKISLDELKKICRKRAAIAYRDHEERQLLLRYGYTRENVIRGLCDIAFTRMDDVADWTNTDVTLKDSEFLSSAAKNSISEVQASYFKGEKVVKVKMHDKLSALNTLLKTLDGQENEHEDMDGSGLEKLLEILNSATKNSSPQSDEKADDERDAVEAVCGATDGSGELPS